MDVDEAGDEVDVVPPERADLASAGASGGRHPEEEREQRRGLVDEGHRRLR